MGPGNEKSGAGVADRITGVKLGPASDAFSAGSRSGGMMQADDDATAMSMRAVCTAFRWVSRERATSSRASKFTRLRVDAGRTRRRNRDIAVIANRDRSFSDWL